MLRFTREFFRRRLVQPLLNFLKQGITPEKLAMAVALGFWLGTFPVLGSTILLCAVFGFMLRLNIPAIQLVNGFVYPLQLSFYIPFYHAGAWIFQTDPIPFSLEDIFSMMANDFTGTIEALWMANVRAMAAWLIFISPLSAMLYWISKKGFSRVRLIKEQADKKLSPA